MNFEHRFFVIWFLMAIPHSLVECDDNDITIFYNVYIPDDPDDSDRVIKKYDRAMWIVKEQLGCRENSIFPKAPLHYITVGKDIGELEDCNNCKRIKHYNNGNEIDTLSHLYEHCTIHQDEKVVYMHDKGSYHRTKENIRLRRLLNKAIFSEECLLLKTPLANNTTTSALRSEESECECNICSARFSPVPYHYMSGNMWVSECSYISKLMHPSNFTAAMDEMIRSASTEEFGNVYKSYREWKLALGRYAGEHWITSHPDR